MLQSNSIPKINCVYFEEDEVYDEVNDFINLIVKMTGI